MRTLQCCLLTVSDMDAYWSFTQRLGLTEYWGWKCSTFTNITWYITFSDCLEENNFSLASVWFQTNYIHVLDSEIVTCVIKKNEVILKHLRYMQLNFVCWIVQQMSTNMPNLKQIEGGHLTNAQKCDWSDLTIGLYRENAIAIQKESGDSNGRKV